MPAGPEHGAGGGSKILLQEHLRRLLDDARAEIEGVLHSTNAREMEAVLDKYAGYPAEIVDGVWQELEMHKEELRRTAIGRVRPCTPSLSLSLSRGVGR